MKLVKFELGEPTMKNFVIRGVLGLSMLFMLAAVPTPADAQVVVKVGPSHRYHHRHYRHVYYRHGHRYYR
jgi:hypothetical protein